MKGLLFIIVFISFISCKEYRSNGCKEMSKYMADTRAMIPKKEYETALTRFIWYYHHAEEKCQSIGPSRLSFGLSYWKELADVYPPALAAMKRVRDSTSYLFILGSGDLEAFKEVNGLNSHLDEDQKTVEIFELIDKRDPQLANQCWRYIDHLLFENRRFNLISKYIKDPMEEYEDAVQWYKMDQSGSNKIAVYDSVNKEIFVSDCLQIIDYCLYIKDVSGARKIQEKAMKLVDDPKLKEAIKE